MAYETWRVEITRDETVADAPAAIEIVAYLDREPETDAPTRGILTRASRGVWNSRLQFTGDFASLREALMAIDAVHPEARHIRCYEYTVDDEVPREVAALVRSAAGWRPAADSAADC